MDEKTLLERIDETLKPFDDHVFYGAVPVTSFDDADPWDFIVFMREDVPVSANCTSIARSYCVVISREGHIPEGLEEEVIDAVRAIPGIKLANDREIEYEYTINPHSHEAVEACAIHFRKGAKV